jgi:hypothetical protein
MTAAVSLRRAIGLKLGARPLPGNSLTALMWKSAGMWPDNSHTSNTRHSDSLKQFVKVGATSQASPILVVVFTRVAPDAKKLEPECQVVPRRVNCQ